MIEPVLPSEESPEFMDGRHTSVTTNTPTPARHHTSRWTLAVAVIVLLLVARGAIAIAGNPQRAASEILQVALYSNLLKVPSLAARARELLRSLAERTK